MAKTVTAVGGVELVLSRSEAARRYHLMPSRIGDLIVLGDKDTVFGELTLSTSELPSHREYCAYRSLHEMDVPLVIHNARPKLAGEDFHYNWELALVISRVRAS